MAKKTSTGRVVDIAALSRIGKTRTAPSQPENRNMDKFLQFAGTIAIDLFSKAFNKKLEMNEKNSIKIDDFKVDNKDAYNTIPALDKAITDYQNMYNDGTKKKVGIFNLPVSEEAKGRSQEGRDLISRADIGLSSLEEETSIYQNSKKNAHDIQHKGFITDPDGRQINASYSGLNLPEDIIFQQAYADGILDDYIEIKDGKFYLPKGIVENIDKVTSFFDKYQKADKLDQTDINDLRRIYTKYGDDANLVPMEKWPKATLSQSDKYDNISIQLQGDAIKMGFARDYDENTDGSTYTTLLKKTTNEMSPNELMSSLFDSTLEFNRDGSIASSGRTIIDNFIDNPTFEVTIDHDGDPKTPKAVFDGTQKYIEREFGKDKTEETLTKEEAGKLAVWKQGVTNELKTALNPNSPDVKDYLIQNGVEQTKFKQQQEWKVSPNNPANKLPEKPSISEIKFMEEKQVLENDVNRFMDSLANGQPYFYSDGKDQYKAVTNNGITSIYKRNIADAEKGTYTDKLQRTIGSGNAFDIIFEGENLNKPEGLNTLTETQIQDQTNPIIRGKLRYNDFTKEGNKYYFPGGKEVKDAALIEKLNSII